MSTLDACAATPFRRSKAGRFIKRNPMLVLGILLLAIILMSAIFAPWLVGDPYAMMPSRRLLPAGPGYPLGTDPLGRDVFARTIYGARVSLTVGICVAAISVLIGLTLGLIAGYLRRANAPLMRIMDALMSIPAIMLAIALVALTQASVVTVIAAIAIPEIPRVVRLVRAVVLSVREQPFVQAAIAGGARTPRVIIRHIMPSTIAPLIVQASYICASAILIEAALSFLGAGTPPSIPTWGNMIASNRLYLAKAPWTIFGPGLELALTVLAINLIGDGLRDHLDPRLSRRM
ncbi:ABC transporter permease [Bradyrhizobium sp. CCBAU 45384]|uniref:ABC transporter permease n=1 Tax=Bradyrhizobium sp. CCBAU 45384 TaxID=858428 RepID=UPI002305B020|nr:ABC transporter permease [Bradyrhizobium sp. CCBAU 45384]MDA9406170.1 peptide ABC transporter permease [Bradyrhizobium sp. CCBAU 45384]